MPLLGRELLLQAGEMPVRPGGKEGAQGRENSPIQASVSWAEGKHSRRGGEDQMMAFKGPRMLDILGQSHFKMRTCNTTQPCTREML